MKQQWQADGQQLAQLLRQKHVDLFATISEEAFNTAVESFLGGVEEWNDQRIRVELVRLAALPSRGGRNGHTLIWPLQEAFGFSILAIKLYWFEEGLFVVDTDRQDLIGARVLRLGSSGTDQVRKSLEPLIARDGPVGLLRYGAPFAIMPNILNALGHTVSPAVVELEFELPSGEVVESTLESISIADYVQRFNTLTLLPNADERPFWARKLEDGIVYAKYNLVQRRGPDGEKLSKFVRDLRALIKADPNAPVVVDVRANGGGNNGTYRPLLELLIESSANTDHRLYCLIGRGTFSAAGNFVTDLEKRSAVILVGEETGGAPNQYGDAKAHRLKHSGIEVLIPTVYWQKGGPDDHRLTHPPRIEARPKAAEYFAGIDGGLAAIRRSIARADG